MFLPAVEVQECGGESLNHQFIVSIEMFVETADSNTGLLHHIGNADAFETEFAKPPGRNAYDPTVCLLLISFRIPLRSSPYFPDPADLAPTVAQLSFFGHHDCEIIIVIYITRMQAAFFWG